MSKIDTFLELLKDDELINLLSEDSCNRLTKKVKDKIFQKKLELNQKNKLIYGNYGLFIENIDFDWDLTHNAMTVMVDFYNQFPNERFLSAKDFLKNLDVVFNEKGLKVKSFIRQGVTFFDIESL